MGGLQHHPPVVGHQDVRSRRVAGRGGGAGEGAPPQQRFKQRASQGGAGGLPVQKVPAGVEPHARRRSGGGGGECTGCSGGMGGGGVHGKAQDGLPPPVRQGVGGRGRGGEVILHLPYVVNLIQREHYAAGAAPGPVGLAHALGGEGLREAKKGGGGVRWALEVVGEPWVCVCVCV
jgi:hypothetical protein